MRLELDYLDYSQTELMNTLNIPLVLLEDEAFDDLSNDAAILYSRFLYRTRLSFMNNWIDEENHVYIIYTIAEISKKMKCKRDKAMALLNELEEFGLIERKRVSRTKPYYIFVKNCNSVLNQRTNEEETDENGGKSTFFTRSEKPTSRGRKNRLHEVGKTDLRNKDIRNKELDIYARGRAAPKNNDLAKKKKNKFMNFSQRDEIDFDALERQLINRSS